MACPASQNYNNQTNEGKKKHAQIFLPVSFLTLKMILVDVGLGDKEMGLVAKLNLSLHLCAIPFHNSLWKQLVPLTPGKSLSAANQGGGYVFSRILRLKETEHEFSCKGQVAGLSHFSVTSFLAWGPIMWRVPSDSILERKDQNAIVSKGGVPLNASG